VLLPAATAAGWNPLAPRPIEVTILTGIIVSSDLVGTPGFSFGALPATQQVTLINRGAIYGARFPSKVDKTSNQAWEVGPALRINSPTTLINSGVIVGGAGSGDPNEGDSCGNCGGGNGGSSGGAGGPAIDALAQLTITNTGTIWG